MSQFNAIRDPPTVTCAFWTIVNVQEMFVTFLVIAFRFHSSTWLAGWRTVYAWNIKKSSTSFALWWCSSCPVLYYCQFFLDLVPPDIYISIHRPCGCPKFSVATVFGVFSTVVPTTLVLFCGLACKRPPSNLFFECSPGEVTQVGVNKFYDNSITVFYVLSGKRHQTDTTTLR